MIELTWDFQDKSFLISWSATVSLKNVFFVVVGEKEQKAAHLEILLLWKKEEEIPHSCQKLKGEQYHHSFLKKNFFQTNKEKSKQKLENP